MGASRLALANILGSVAFNVLLLAVADVMLRQRPLTSVVAQPSTLIHGVLGMMLLALVAAAIEFGETPVAGVGVWSLLLFASCLAALRVAYRSERRPRWAVLNALPGDAAAIGDKSGRQPHRIYRRTAGLALVILVAGTLLASAGDAIATRTGLGDSLFGLLFVALATSLPELSSITGAIRRRSYEMAVGEVFGSNIFELALVLAIDAVAPGPPVLAMAGKFEALAALLGLALTGLYVLGLIERRDRTLLGMGYDSIAALALYAVALAFLVGLSR
jgi:cation:H+ antiporter